MPNSSNVSFAGRRSDRVSIAFPVEVSWIDPAGQRFQCRTKTEVVSNYGCCLRLPQSLACEQEVHVRRFRRAEPVAARVVAHLTDRRYGVAMTNSCETLWGIRFSPFSLQEKLMDRLYEGAYIVNRDRRIAYWNQGAQRLSGYSADEVIGKGCFEGLMGHIDDCGKALCGEGCSLSRAMQDGHPKEARVYLRHKNGYRVPVNVRVLPLLNSNGEVDGAMEVFSEVMATVAPDNRVAELENMAFRDSLTNLPNRRYLELKVTQAIEDYRQFARQYGLLLFDLDRFKQVNDNYGHEAGDTILKAISGTLVHSLRPVDVVGRWGGEEFLVLLVDAVPVALGDLAERCRVLVAGTSIVHGESQLSVTASVGATLLSPEDSASTAIRRADELMYKSKRSGGNKSTVE